jgi:hypothetical protein
MAGGNGPSGQQWRGERLWRLEPVEEKWHLDGHIYSGARAYRWREKIVRRRRKWRQKKTGKGYFAMCFSLIHDKVWAGYLPHAGKIGLERAKDCGSLNHNTHGKQLPS